MALRSVPAAKAPARRRSGTPQTVSDAAENGTEKDLLVAMRRRIAKTVDDPDTAARDLASLTKRLNEVVRDIKAIDAREKQEAEDADAAVADDAFDASAI